LVLLGRGSRDGGLASAYLGQVGNYVQQQKSRSETFPGVVVSSASNETLLDELLRVAGWMDWATTAAQNRHYEEYTAELKAEVLRRMSG
jgi:hypothetical protein